MKLKDKVAIITGSTSGIGLGIAKKYLLEGAKVVVSGINEDDIKNVMNEFSNTYNENDYLITKCDITKTEDVIKLFNDTINKFGKLDILVNNAGIAPAKSIEEMVDDDFINVININLVGAFKCTREAVKYMKENGGSIINTSSFVSLYASPYQSAYSASKAGLNGLTKSNAKELGKYKIRVNAVLPGVVMTDMVKNNVDPKQIEGLKMMTPIGRACEVDDIVGIYVYFASDDSKCTTGSLINIDGGLVM